MMRQKVLLALLSLLVAGCVAEAFSGGGARGKPCRHGDRRCKGGAGKAPVYALEVFWGGIGSQALGGGTVSTQAGVPLTVARSSSTLCGDSAGGYSNQVAANTACTELQGLAARSATNNLVKTSNDPTQWTLDGTTSVAAVDTCPDGTAGTGIYDTTANGTHRFYRGANANQGAGYYTFSMAVKPIAANPIRFIQTSFGTNGEAATFDIINKTVAITGAGNFTGYTVSDTAYSVTPSSNGFSIISFTMHDTSGFGGFAINNYGTTTANIGSYAGVDAGAVICSNQITFSKNFGGPRLEYVPNDGGSGQIGTRQADLISVANPLDAGPFVLAATIWEDNGVWDNSLEHGIAGGGWDAGNDNDSFRWFVSDAGFQTFVVTDHQGVQQTTVATTVTWAGRRFLQVIDNSGTVTLYQDGAPDGGLLSLPTATTGGGDGYVKAMPTTMFVGSEGFYGNQLGGVVQDFCANNYTGTECNYKYSHHFLAPLYAKRTLLALGDSLTNNTLPFAYWPALLHTDLPAWTTSNAGIPTWRIAQVEATFLDGGWTSVNPKVTAAAANQYTSIECGINDSTTLIYSTLAELKFWHKYVWDEISKTGSTPLILRESPWTNEVGWNSTLQDNNYDPLQVYVQNEAALYGYPYRDFYGIDGGLTDGGGTYPVLLCQFDYDSDGSKVVCPDGTGGVVQPNWAHYNDAGSGQMEHYIISGGWFL